MLKVNDKQNYENCKGTNGLCRKRTRGCSIINIKNVIKVHNPFTIYYNQLIIYYNFIQLININ